MMLTRDPQEHPRQTRTVQSIEISLRLCLSRDLCLYLDKVRYPLDSRVQRGRHQGQTVRMRVETWKALMYGALADIAKKPGSIETLQLDAEGSIG